MPAITTSTVEAPAAVLTYDVHVPDAPDDHPPLFLFGSPMSAEGFADLAQQFPDRAVITYDPRGTARSTRDPGAELTVATHAEDYHRVVAAAGLGPVNALGSSGGGMCGLEWVTSHPEDVRTFVAHEPPLIALLPDGALVARINDDILATYHAAGRGPAMAKFIRMVMHEGPFTDDFITGPPPDPAQFGLPTEDDGARDDLLLAGNLAMPPYEPDRDTLLHSATRIVPAVGEVGEGSMARRGGEALADLLGTEPAVFPGDHAGFLANEWSPGNDPAAFAARLREVLDDE